MDRKDVRFVRSCGLSCLRSLVPNQGTLLFLPPLFKWSMKVRSDRITIMLNDKQTRKVNRSERLFEVTWSINSCTNSVLNYLLAGAYSDASQGHDEICAGKYEALNSFRAYSGVQLFSCLSAIWGSGSYIFTLTHAYTRNVIICAHRFMSLSWPS
jgi:hypothetical protein